MENYEEETSGVGGFFPNWPTRILAAGRPRTSTRRVGDEKRDQGDRGARVRESL